MDGTDVPGRVRVCVFAKPPRPGVSKTRLIPAVGASGAATLAEAFLIDTWTALESLPWADPVLVVTTEDSLITNLARNAPIWLQGEGDLGARLERTLQRALSIGGPVLAVGADSPGMPPRLLEDVKVALTNHEAVLAPADDGGFYAIGLRRCPVGSFSDLPWSAADTLAATKTRLASLGLSVAVTEPWFDVDREEDLHRLADLLAQDLIFAPATERVLRRMGRIDPCE